MSPQEIQSDLEIVVDYYDTRTPAQALGIAVGRGDMVIERVPGKRRLPPGGRAVLECLEAGDTVDEIVRSRQIDLHAVQSLFGDICDQLRIGSGPLSALRGAYSLGILQMPKMIPFQDTVLFRFSGVPEVVVGPRDKAFVVDYSSGLTVVQSARRNGFPDQGKGASARVRDRLGARDLAEGVTKGILLRWIKPSPRPNAPRVLDRATVEIATLVAQGRSNQEIATFLSRTVGSVENRLARGSRKLGVLSRMELVRRLFEDDVFAVDTEDRTA
jgi:DNA-binding CsgD family transcriptional regulator